MKPTIPEVSVVMPVRNGEAYLEFAVSSIIAQTFQSWELIAVDDGSIDATLVLLRRFAAADARIHVITSGGAGIVDALNQGIRTARAELIARMDADDVALPDRLARQVRQMKTTPSLVAAGSTAIKIDSHGNETGLISVPSSASAIAEEMKWRNPFLHPTMIMRTDAVRRAGLYRSGCTYAEDYDLWLRLEETGALSNLAEPALKLRVHAAQTSRTKRFQQRAATSLARQSAWRRRAGKSEGVNMARSLDECCAEFLLMRTSDATRITEGEARDLSLILRFVHENLPLETVTKLAKRIQVEGQYKYSRLLRLRLSFARLSSLFRRQNVKRRIKT